MKFIVLALVMAVLFFSAVARAEKSAVCHLPHSKTGNVLSSCVTVKKFWSYDAPTNTCLTFPFVECDRNANNFYTKEACEATCKDP